MTDYLSEKIVQEFIELAKIDAASRQERGVADAIIAKLTAMGFTVEEDNTAQAVKGNTGNVHAYLEGNLPGSVLFMAHMDRVQNGIGIHPVIYGNQLKSDGSTILAADDLSGVSAILDGARRILQTGEKHVGIEIVFSVCEEIGLQGSLNLDPSVIRSKFGYVLDSPGKTGTIYDSAMGKAQMILTVHGKSAHAAYPELGISALHSAVKVLSQLEDGRVDDETVVNWSYLVSDTPFNAISGSAQAKGLAMSRSNQKLKEYLQKYTETAAKAADETKAEIEAAYHIDYPSFFVEEEKPSIQAAKKALEAIGISPKIKHGAGGFDANRMNGYGIEMVGLSTGYSLNHTVNETLELDDLIQAGEMVASIIRCCKG
ncbi:MAG: M20/M25/M40 family metallo-hydrolase [Lachnospiraceae bacterium]|nr:M20/M25/M40 family metallo-hydrolase [Lachnospiraceae bacterium]